MALQKTITTKDNFGRDAVFPDAYIKVSHIFGDKNVIVATIDTTDSKPVFDADGNSFHILVSRVEYKFMPQLHGSNFIAQAYEHLKVLPEFASAADV